MDVCIIGACDGYARMARLPALALLHLGPGLGNGLCNLHNARRAGSPIVVMVGDMATWHRAAGKGGSCFRLGVMLLRFVCL
jgi:acetolactate synthase-1/2/3 large subunit